MPALRHCQNEHFTTTEKYSNGFLFLLFSCCSTLQLRLDIFKFEQSMQTGFTSLVRKCKTCDLPCVYNSGLPVFTQNYQCLHTTHHIRGPGMLGQGHPLTGASDHSLCRAVGQRSRALTISNCHLISQMNLNWFASSLKLQKKSLE